jgi:hypothetical protein
VCIEEEARGFPRRCATRRPDRRSRFDVWTTRTLGPNPSRSPRRSAFSGTTDRDRRDRRDRRGCDGIRVSGR